MWAYLHNVLNIAGFLRATERAKTIAPTNPERLAGWIAVVWALSSVFIDPITNGPLFRSVVTLVPEPTVAPFLMILGLLQIVSSALRWLPGRAVSCVTSLTLWSFLAVQSGLMSGFTGSVWTVAAVIAWSQSCSLSCVLRGERRR